MACHTGQIWTHTGAHTPPLKAARVRWRQRTIERQHIAERNRNTWNPRRSSRRSQECAIVATVAYAVDLRSTSSGKKKVNMCRRSLMTRLGKYIVRILHWNALAVEREYQCHRREEREMRERERR